MNAITLYRAARFFYLKRIPVLPWVIRNLIFLIFNSYVPPSAKIGRGTVFAYGGMGVVIHADAIIGDYCVIGQGVTIGAAEGFFSHAPNRCPEIGDHVYLAAGSRVLGDIRIGSRVIVGASAVVTHDVEDHSIVAGIPARKIGETEPDYRAIRD